MRAGADAPSSNVGIFTYAKVGAQASSRVAPQVIFRPVPAKSGTGLVFFRSARCPTRDGNENKKRRKRTMAENKIPYKIYLNENELPKQ